MESTSSNSSVTEASEPQFDYAALIRAVMKERRIPAKKLFQDNIIRKCTWREFDKRLSTGQITTAELNALVAYLDIDPVRATLALFCLHNAEAYFEATCETASHLASETVIVLSEQIAACDGDFEPIKQTLCRSLAQRTSGMIVEHHKRVEEVRTGVASA